MDTKELFKILVKAYYEDNFEATVNALLLENKENEDTINNIISALCGVDSPNNSAACSNELEAAIFNYVSSNKVVVRVKDCVLDCMTKDGKTNCQKSCPFDAISINEKQCKVLIDKIKCTDCGFCVEVCPNNCYIDKVEFLPLAKLLLKKGFSI